MLLDIADDLDAEDLRAGDAMGDVRRASRVLAEAVHARGWGDLYLGLECDDSHRDELEDSEVGDREVEGQQPLDLGDGFEEVAEEPAVLPLPAGTRVTYQARFDFVVTDPTALLEHVGGLLRSPRRADVDLRDWSVGGPDGNEGEAVTTPRQSAPADVVEAIGLLAYHDGLGSRDYTGVGLDFAGGHEVVRPIAAALWEMELSDQDDAFPFH